MAEESVLRRLAAILAADVVGYSRLMGSDEAGTRSRFNSHLSEFIEPMIAQHRGRLVKEMGDGLLVEFASVIDAVRCAAKIQDGMRERNVDNDANQPFEFRIGVNLGDVIVEGDDIHGAWHAMARSRVPRIGTWSYRSCRRRQEGNQGIEGRSVTSHYFLGEGIHAK